jgi:hypothetical protein
MGMVTFHIQTTEAAGQQAAAGVAPPLPMPVATAARQLRYELDQTIQTLGMRIWIASSTRFRIIVRDVPDTDMVSTAAVVERVLAGYPGWRYLVARDARSRDSHVAQPR